MLEIFLSKIWNINLCCFFFGKCLAAKVKVVKKGQKTVFGPKLPPAKIFLAQKCIIRDLLICTLKIRYK